MGNTQNVFIHEFPSSQILLLERLILNKEKILFDKEIEILFQKEGDSFRRKRGRDL